jgi:predicted dehydrogenase
VDLVAVCDLDESKARRAAKRFGDPRVFTSAEEMLATEGLDFVDIATTMGSHEALVGLAARHGLPTIVQKPLAPDWRTCLAIVASCRDAGVPFMVHENTRFLTPVRRARAAIDRGAIGVPNWARVSFRTGHDIYGKQPYLARETHFVILDLGVHMLDVARYLMGEVSSLYCQSQSIKPGIAGEDKATILLKHENGATSLVECSYASPTSPDPFPELFVQVEGSQGSLRIDTGYRMTVLTGAEARVEDVSPAMLPWSTPPWHGTQESVQRIQKQWVSCLRSGTTPETSGEDSLRTYGLVFAAYESAASGQAMAPLAP